jgi:hypothetical protein
LLALFLALSARDTKFLGDQKLLKQVIHFINVNNLNPIRIVIFLSSESESNKSYASRYLANCGNVMGIGIVIHQFGLINHLHYGAASRPSPNQNNNLDFDPKKSIFPFRS